VAILNPEHLFVQADRLVAPPLAGPPRQVDVRRAISSAYYGVFHATLTAAADQVVGATRRSSGHYALVYRSIDHKTLRILCEIAQRRSPPAKHAPYIPAGGFGPNISAYAEAVVDLQEKRLSADYDPRIRIKSFDAKLAIRAGRAAVQRLNAAAASEREAFLSLLLFSPR
jgi:hypothetical protein